MIKYLCKYPQCQNPVNNKDEYCIEHQNSTIVKKNRKYGVTSKLYNTAEWRKMRKVVLTRDNYTCQNCGSQTKVVVDHIIPHRENLELFIEETNLITLCKECHDNKTRKEIQKRKEERKQALKHLDTESNQ
ncbi:MAG: HNH endonuclease [Halanaerobiales bacterium]